MSTPGVPSLSEHLESTVEGMASVMQVAGLVALAIAVVVFGVASARGQRLGPSVKLLLCASVVALAPMALSVVGSIEPVAPVAHASLMPSSQDPAPGLSAVEVKREPSSPPQTWEAGGSID